MKIFTFSTFMLPNDSTTQLSTQVNLNTLNEYFNYLQPGFDPDQTVFCFFIFAPDGTVLRANLKIPLNPLLQIFTEVLKLEDSKATLHVTLNQVDDNTLTSRFPDIRDTRVLCVDFDSQLTKDKLTSKIQIFTPSFVVESSPGKYHFYWCLIPPFLLPFWENCQAGLAELNKADKADKALASRTHLIRVPGITRLLDDGTFFDPSIVYRATLPPLPPLKFPMDYFQTRYNISELGSKVREDIEKQQFKIAKQLAKGSFDPKKVKVGARNSTLYSYCLEYIKKGNGLFDNLQVQNPYNSPGYRLLVENALAFNASFPTPIPYDNEVIKTATSAFNAGLDQRATILALKTEYQKKKPSFDYDYTLPDIADGNRFTDKGVFERVVQRFGPSLCRVLSSGGGSSGRLHAFDAETSLWTPQTPINDIVVDMAYKVAEDVVCDETFLERCCGLKKDKINETLKERETRHFQGFQLINRVADLAIKRRGDPRILRKEIHEFDANPHLFHCRDSANSNIVLNLKTLETRPSAREDFLMRQSDVVYDPAATCPYWLIFLDQIMQDKSLVDKKEYIEFLQQLFGYTLSGAISDQQIYVHEGPGGNGKSKVMAALKLLLGKKNSAGYMAIIPASALITAQYKTAVTEFSLLSGRLEGCRLGLCEDAPDKGAWKEEFIKLLTSEDITARRLYQNETQIVNRAKIHICCNDVPTSVSTNLGLFRRITPIPYRVNFTKEATGKDIDPEKLKQKEDEINSNIATELSGILNWALQGYQIMLKNGGNLKRPATMQRAKDALRLGSSPYAWAVDAIFVRYQNEHDLVSARPSANPECWNTLTTLMNDAKEYLGKFASDIAPMTPQKFGKLIQDRGFPSDKTTKKGVDGLWYCVNRLQPATEIKLNELGEIEA